MKDKAFDVATSSIVASLAWDFRIGLVAGHTSPVVVRIQGIR
jgi:hypothetical protein